MGTGDSMGTVDAQLWGNCAVKGNICGGVNGFNELNLCSFLALV